MRNQTEHALDQTSPKAPNTRKIFVFGHIWMLFLSISSECLVIMSQKYFCPIRLLKTDGTMTSRNPPSPSSSPDKFDMFVYSDFKYVQSIQYNCTVADHKRPVYRSILWRVLLYSYTYFCHIRFLADVTYTLECPPI